MSEPEPGANESTDVLTGRRFILAERATKKGMRWGVELVGEFETLATLQVLTKTMDYVITLALSKLKEEETLLAVKNKLAQMNEENKSDDK